MIRCSCQTRSSSRRRVVHAASWRISTPVKPIVTVSFLDIDRDRKRSFCVAVRFCLAASQNAYACWKAQLYKISQWVFHPHKYLQFH